MKIHKITIGFVIQVYEGTKCISQEFVAGDPADYENEHGVPVDPIENEEYQPFNMVQPEEEENKALS